MGRVRQQRRCVRPLLSALQRPATASEDRGAVDFLQFPRQTLTYSSGDCDDLTALYIALLESVGVDTAFITVPGHIYAAFAVETSPEEARREFV
ncbi:MAG: hypothetical protein ACOC7V_16970, partial [Spirochaetota bacterium]